MDNLDYDYIAELVENAKTGSSDAFAELYAATYQKIYRFACRYLRDENLAQDALQETFIVVFKSISTLRDARLFISWINQICFRVCFKMQRENEEFYKASAAENERLDRQRSASPEDIVISVDSKKFLASRILSLPSSEGQVIILHYYNDLKLDEIARLLDISRSSVKRYLASGRDKLSRLAAEI